MRLPELSAGKSINNVNNVYRDPFESSSMNGVEMEGFLDTLISGFGSGGLVGDLIKSFGGSKGSCIMDCVGSKGIPTALKCISCGTNPGCWATCAGPEVAGCIGGCI